MLCVLRRQVSFLLPSLVLISERLVKITSSFRLRNRGRNFERSWILKLEFGLKFVGFFNPNPFGFGDGICFWGRTFPKSV